MANVEKNSAAEAIKALVEANAGVDFKKMRTRLRRIINGKAYEDKFVNVKVSIDGKPRVVTMIRRVEPANRDVISAIKALKELIMDKVLADVKDTQKHEVKFSTKTAVEEVAAQKRKEAEAKALKEGKLAGVIGDSK